MIASSRHPLLLSSRCSAIGGLIFGLVDNVMPRSTAPLCINVENPTKRSAAMTFVTAT